ncbi:hypothetical protein ACERZ8_16665 [Tateyamaria armeniaca]|uniref:Uncharacterized protein n=1 Tax=Tateyamaria armeniaca TaxID=2518930 RepID=A0ABW8UWI2_9RHOB
MCLATRHERKRAKRDKHQGQTRRQWHAVGRRRLTAANAGKTTRGADNLTHKLDPEGTLAEHSQAVHLPNTERCSQNKGQIERIVTPNSLESRLDETTPVVSPTDWADATNHTRECSRSRRDHHRMTQKGAIKGHIRVRIQQIKPELRDHESGQKGFAPGATLTRILTINECGRDRRASQPEGENGAKDEIFNKCHDAKGPLSRKTGRDMQHVPRLPVQRTIRDNGK